MVGIAEDSGLHTLVVTFTVTPDKQADLVQYLQGVAADHSEHDGFVSCSIHRSGDGLRVVEYIQWQTREHLQAVLATPEARAHVTDPSRQADAHAYVVASVTEAPAGRLPSPA